MNDNLDDWLNSIGVPIDPSVRETVPSDEAEEVPSEQPQPQSLSEDDFDDILEDFGFSRAENAQAEEIHDGSDDEGVEEESTPTMEDYNNSPYSVQAVEQVRDLDAEEDADWQEAIDSGSVVPVEFDPASVADQEVHFHMPDGEVVDVPILTQTASDFDRGVIPTEQPPAREPLIPLNSPTLLIDESTTRFSGAEWFNEIQKQNIIVGGCGGIGSNLVFQLARMHPASMFIYDDDRVETVNMAGQLFSRNDVGKTKVSAMSDMISSYTNMQNIYAINQRYTSETEAGNVMMCGFDNMEARKIFFSSWNAHTMSLPEEERKKCLYLDGRLSIDTLQVLCITGDDYSNMERYIKEYLFSDSEAEHTVCSMKQTTYLACMIGSFMTNLFTNWVADLLDPVIPYDLPFFTEYDAQNMIFKTVK